MTKERPLFDMFINEIYLYGDWLVIPCNRKDGAETIALEDTAPFRLLPGMGLVS